MILDSSAVIAVIFRERGYERLKRKLDQAKTLRVGAPTLFETNMVALGTFEERGRQLVTSFIEDWDVSVIAFGDRHGRMATDAFLRYGKGRHPARLNLGDCMTYAVARVAGEPLLFTGNDFAQTDIAPA